MKPAADWPARILALPRDRAGHPVPWFVAWIAGEPDFRVVRASGIHDAIRYDRCWVCGDRLGTKWSAFTIGPMCALNRTTAEPPSHRECAIFSATHCPFLTTPAMGRRESRMPEEAIHPAGTMIRRNPGVALVWITRRWRLFPDGSGGVLIDVGDPVETMWFAHGREATRDEVLASIDSGLPILQDMAAAEGPKALEQLEAQRVRALELVPA